MAAITETHKAANASAATAWLEVNGFSLSAWGWWSNDGKRYARCERLPSGKVMIYVGVV